ncbi:MAG: hypothetical protein MUO26_10100 [Methanotrichaceae archaeon]|nr:hypothetical protein [Methanotrichaceae archaeon]
MIRSRHSGWGVHCDVIDPKQSELQEVVLYLRCIKYIVLLKTPNFRLSTRKIDMILKG